MTSPSPVPDPPLQLRPDVTDVNDEDASAQREELVAEIRRLKEEKLRAVEAFQKSGNVSNIFVYFHPYLGKVSNKKTWANGLAILRG